MSFKTFLSKISPTYGKKTLLSDIEQISDSLKTYSLPAYTILLNQNKKPEFNSEQAKSFEQNYVSKVKRTNMYVGIKEVLENSSEICDYLIQMVEDRFADDITRSTVSAFMLNIMQLIQAVAFVSDYSRRLLNFLITAEINKESGKDEVFGITPAELKFIKEYKYNFIAALAVLSEPKKSIEQKLEKVPDILLNPENIETVTRAVGSNTIDPMKMNFFSVRWNPSMIIVKRITNYQVNKYKQAQADLQEIQCKILKLKQQREDREDAKLDKQIEYYTNQNDRIKAEIERMEEEYGLR